MVTAIALIELERFAMKIFNIVLSHRKILSWKWLFGLILGPLIFGLTQALFIIIFPLLALGTYFIVKNIFFTHDVFEKMIAALIGLFFFAIFMYIYWILYPWLPVLMLFILLSSYLVLRYLEAGNLLILEFELNNFRLPLSGVVLYNLLFLGPSIYLVTFVLGRLYPEMLNSMDISINHALEKLESNIATISVYLQAGQNSGVYFWVILCISFIWILLIFVGINYLISRSMRYTLQAFVLAMFININYIIITYINAVYGNSNWQGVMSTLTDINQALRIVVIAPLDFVFSFLLVWSDVKVILDTCLTIIQTILSLALELSARVALAHVESLVVVVKNLYDHAQLVELPLLSFVISSIILGVFARGVKKQNAKD